MKFITYYKKHYLYFLIILILGLLLFTPGVNKTPITDQDEAHFAQATKQMIETKNYFLVAFQNTIRYQKPPGINWLQAISNLSFSKSPYTKVWPYRLPSVLGGLFTLLLTFLTAKRYMPVKTAILAPIILGSTTLLIIESHLAVIDACLLVTITLQQAVLLKLFIEKKISKKMVGLFWVSLSLGIALKGVTLLVAILTILTISIIKKDTKWLSHLYPALGIPFLLISLFWLPLLTTTNNENYLWMMLKKDLFPKLRGGSEKHGAPFGTFFIMSFILFWPMSLHFSHTLRYAWKKRKEPLVFFLLAWIIPTWLFFEIMPTKLPQYILPVFPAIAILIALSIYNQKTHPCKNSNIDFWYQNCWLALSLITIGLILTASFYLLKIIPISLIIAAVLFITGVIISTYQQHKGNWTSSTLTLCLTAICFFGILFHNTAPNIQQAWITQAVTQKITTLEAKKLISPKTPIFAIDDHEPSLTFNLGTNRVIYAEPTSINNLLKKSSAHQAVLLLNENSLKNIKLPKNVFVKNDDKIMHLDLKYHKNSNRFNPDNYLQKKALHLLVINS